MPIRTALLILIAIMLSACTNTENSEPQITSSQNEDFAGALESITTDNAERSEAYQDALDVLHDLGNYGFDEDNFGSCESDGLESFYLRRQLPTKFRQAVQTKFSDTSGKEIFAYVVNMYEKSEQDINRDFKTDQFNEELENNLLMHLIWLAAEKGDVDALNEIGAAQTYCYQGIQQDIESAVGYLKKAAKTGDILSNMSLGKIYYSGLGDYSNKALGMEHHEVAFNGAIEELRNAKVLSDSE